MALGSPIPRDPRLGLRRPVHFYRIDELVRAYSDDLSDRGVFVRTDAWLPVNGVIDLRLMLSDHSPLMVAARVAYCLPPDQARLLGRRSGIGFEFLDPGASQLQRLRGYLQRLRAARGEPRLLGRRRVLIACAHPRLRKRLVHALSPAGLSITTVRCEVDLRAQALFEWDALVLDGTLVGARLLADLAHLGGGRPPPLLYLAAGHDEIARLHAYRAGATECLPRPFTDEELRLRVEQALRRRERHATPDLAGTLARMPLGSVLSLLEQERRSGVLSLEGVAGQLVLSVHQGRICAVDGRLDRSAHAQVLSALCWKAGYYEFRSDRAVPSTDEAWPIAGLLLEGARLQDEARAGRAPTQLGGLPAFVGPSASPPSFRRFPKMTG